ncbi:Flp family type IVb pilin [Vibrio aquaticus]|uniref:Flp family type IVb pilin n=1 Tax=Vibrio aquaticus TaxID=2496559 RepID=A0A432CWZ8_9VIBR|nr:Flp family type IVb pilin [Vibrio aquaticus]RTZ15596.1 Flp family type IVb pilin [Vibrio aquaticus]
MITKLFVKAQVALANYKNDEQGVTAIEYGLIAAGISIIIATQVESIGTALTGIFTDIADALS